MTENIILHIAYAEDHVIVRKGITALLNDMPGLVVDIEADNGHDLLQQIEDARIKPNVCILDINMPGMNGFDAIIELKKRWPEMGVLVLTVFDIEYYFIRMIMSGANGYLLKSCDPEEIRRAIFSIFNNGMYYSDMTTRTFFLSIINKEIKLPTFTDAEMAVLQMCCSDMSYGDIGEKLGTSTKSVEGHRDNLFRKLKVNSRISLAMFAVQFGLTPLETNIKPDDNFFNKKPK